MYRFNLFKTKGFEKHAGSKTTHWILSMIKKAKDIDDEEVPAITQHLQEIIIPMAFRDCKDPHDMAKGCPGTKPKNGPKRMAETAKEQKKWQDLPPTVKVTAKELSENKILYGKYKLYEKFPSTGLMILNMAAEQYDEVAFVGGVGRSTHTRAVFTTRGTRVQAAFTETESVRFKPLTTTV